MALLTGQQKVCGDTAAWHASLPPPDTMWLLGVLPIAIGGATRFIQYLSSAKQYETTIKFGVATTSDDLTGCVA